MATDEVSDGSSTRTNDDCSNASLSPSALAVHQTDDIGNTSCVENENGLSSRKKGDSPGNSECTVPWRGKPLHDLKNPTSTLPPLKTSTEHEIFFNYTNRSAACPSPYPDNYKDEWSEDFVRMPCSPESMYAFVKEGKKSLVSRWSLIEETLRKPIKSVSELSEAIISYNWRFRQSWKFNVLNSLFTDNLLPDGNEETFFNRTLPAMCALALNLPVYLTKPIPLMRRGREMSLTFSQLQIASILANAFFCTFPRRNSWARTAEFSNFPSINFSSLMSANNDRPFGQRREFQRKQEKLRCLLHYFNRVTESMPTGTVTYTRRCLGDKTPNWAESSLSFDHLRVHINAVDTIEHAGSNSLQVDFANRYLGGGALNSGCVQEEIMFMLRPELIASRLFIESLSHDETVIIEGAECFSTSAGYAENFVWTGDFCQSEQDSERDEWGRWNTTVVAMDATRFTQRDKQYTPSSIARELNKAYCGFTDDLAPNRKLPSLVATGNWGCGAFKGNVDLKGLIQMTACLQAGKSMAYFTFRDHALCDRLYGMYEFLSSNKITVGALWNVLNTLDSSVCSEPETLYDYVKSRLSAAL